MACVQLACQASIKVHAENKTYASNKNSKGNIVSERVKIFYA
jgi:hypothetical protein